MLVLSRKSEEKIQIGDDVFVTVLGIRGNTVCIGVDAPREIVILRSEQPKVVSATATDTRQPTLSSRPPPAIDEVSG